MTGLSRFKRASYHRPICCLGAPIAVVVQWPILHLDIYHRSWWFSGNRSTSIVGKSNANGERPRRPYGNCGCIRKWLGGKDNNNNNSDTRSAQNVTDTVLLLLKKSMILLYIYIFLKQKTVVEENGGRYLLYVRYMNDDDVMASYIVRGGQMAWIRRRKTNGERTTYPTKKWLIVISVSTNIETWQRPSLSPLFLRHQNQLKEHRKQRRTGMSRRYTRPNDMKSEICLCWQDK